MGGDARSDTSSDMVMATDAWGGTEGLAERTARWRAWSRATAPRKAEVVYRAAQALAGHGIKTVDDVRELFTDQGDSAARQAVKQTWHALPGQRSGLTWTYFLMLCKVPGVKADRMIVRYVTDVLGRIVSPEEAATLMMAVSTHLGQDPILIDHAIWRYASDRPFLRPQVTE